MIWLLPHRLPPLSAASCLSFSVSLCVVGVTLTNERGGRGVGGGAKSYSGVNAWSSMNHPILSAQGRCFILPGNPGGEITACQPI
jgi:hypothetical protein